MTEDTSPRAGHGAREWRRPPRQFLEWMTALGLAARTDMPEALIRTLARTAEDAGYRSLWVNNPPGHDGLTPAAWALDATATISVGTGVVPVSHHPPAGIAERVHRLRLPADRYRLGVGSGSGEHPRDRLRAALRELRPLVEHELVAAALGPLACRVAGEEADAVLLNAVSPALARRSADLARAGAGAAGRTVPRVYASVLVGVGPEGRDRLEQVAGFYARIPFYAAHFQRLGLAPADVMVGVDEAAELDERLAPWRGVVDELVVGIAAAPEEVPRLVGPVQAAWRASERPSTYP